MSERETQYEETIAYLEKQVSDLDTAVQELTSRLHEQGKELATLRRQYEAHLAELHEPQIPDTR